MNETFQRGPAATDRLKSLILNELASYQGVCDFAVFADYNHAEALNQAAQFVTAIQDSHAFLVTIRGPNNHGRSFVTVFYSNKVDL